MEECEKYMTSFELEIKIIEGLVKKTDNNKIKELLKQDVDNKKNLLSKYRSVLSNIASDEICCRLFAKILEGTPPTIAVEKIATENYHNNIKPYSLSAIWRYYSKIKELLE